MISPARVLALFTILVALILPAAAVPTVTTLNPAAGSTLSALTSITVTFNESVAGVDAEDLLIAGNSADSVVQADGSGAKWTFNFTQPYPGEVLVYWDVDHAITNQSGVAFVPGSSWTYTLTDSVAPTVTAQSPPPGATVNRLTQCEVTFSEEVFGVDAGDLLVNGTAATSVSGVGAGPFVFTFPQPANGTINFAWAPAHGITDAATLPNAFAGGSWTVTMNTAQATGNVVINEVLAANVSLDSKVNPFVDEDGAFSSWIELTNRGAAAVDLAGWSLTDDASKPGQWVFPTGAQSIIAPGQFLVIWCDGKDRKAPTGGAKMHTNFTLKAGGEYLGLFSAALPREAVHQFSPTYPVQRGDVSYGFDSAAALKYFSTPTPGAGNGTSTIAGIAQPVSFSVKRGYFSSAFDLVLSTTTLAATIRYTTNGSVPTATNGTVYSAPLAVSATTVVRAAAFATNMLNSDVGTQSYIYVASTLSQPASPAGYPTGNVWTPNPGTIENGSRAYYQVDAGIVASNNATIRAGLAQIPTMAITLPIPDLFDPSTGIYSHPQSKGPQWERGGSMELLFPDGSESSSQLDCGIQIQGGSSRSQSKNFKHSFRLSFKDDYGTSKLSRKLYLDSPVTDFDTFVIDGGSNYTWDYVGASNPTDQRQRAQQVRDAYTSDLLNAMGWPSFHSRFMHLYINGLYWGLNYIHERSDRSFAATYFGGEKEDYDVVRNTTIGTLEVQTTTQGFVTQSLVPNDPHLVTWNAMMAFANSGLSNNAQYQQIQQYLDVPAFCDYMIANFYTGNDDWPHHNFYGSRRRVPGGKFYFTIWDAEHTLKSATYYGKFDATDANGPGQLWANLRQNAEFRLLFADRVQKHFFNGGVCFVDPAHPAYDGTHPEWDRPAALYMRRITEINNAIAAESAKWGAYTIFYGITGGATYTRGNQWLTELNNLLGLQANTGYTNNYFPTRSANVIPQFQSRSLFPASTAGAPIFSKFGGRVSSGTMLTMTRPAGTSGTIYYTTNGTDPRVFGSGLPATAANGGSAQIYSTPLSLIASGTVKARVLNGSTWSAVVSADFAVDSPAVAIRINELMYNPIGGSDFEFVELKNVGSVDVNLGGYSFIGITFLFPPSTILAPGARVVLGSNGNVAAWQARYPSVTAVGYFDGSLSNSGERIALLDVNGNTVTSVTYSNAHGWPAAANGGGSSLEVNDAIGDPNDPANWRASAAANGTPGLPNSVPVAASIELSEVLVKNVSINIGGIVAPFIELRNTTGAAISLAGWSLSNDGNVQKFVFPAGTSIAANGYLSVLCDTGFGGALLHTGFALNGGPAGDKLQLYNASSTWADGIGWGNQIADFSIGKVGGVWGLTAPSPCAANNSAATASAAGNLVVNEWLTNPPAGQNGWLELYNKSATQPVALKNLFVQTSSQLFQITALAFVAPQGWLQLFADELPGANHVDFTLPASGTTLSLLDSTGAALDSVSFGAQVQGVSQGRNPDGSATIASFPGSGSPGAANYVANWTGPVLDEALASNVDGALSPAGIHAGWMEIYNPTASAFALGGMRLGAAADYSTAWTIPAGTSIAAGSYIVLWCDVSQPASTVAGAALNTGFALGTTSGGAYLFNSTGQLVNKVEWGFQITDTSIGLSGGTWKLLASPTLGAANSAAAALGAVANLRINEWLAAPASGTDWFELYNLDPAPVAMDGLFLTDDPSELGRTKFQVALLSFIGAKGWVQWRANSTPGLGRNHVNFSLDANAETIRLTNNDVNFTAIDAVTFGQQTTGVSQGRIPDGGAIQPGLIPTPAAKNVLPPAPSFSLQPVSQPVPQGANVTFTTTASGSAPLTFQWKFNGTDIPGATGTSLTVNAVTPANDGNYTLVATNTAGIVPSSVAKLTVTQNFTQWATSNSLTGGNAAPGADPDSDGVTNIQELFHHLDPNVPFTATERDALPKVGIEPATGTPQFLTLTYRTNPRATFSLVEHQISPTLGAGTWTTVVPDVTEQLTPDEITGDPRVRVKFSILPGANKKFLRLQLTP